MHENPKSPFTLVSQEPLWYYESCFHQVVGDKHFNILTFLDLFLSPPVPMHGGLLCIAFCLSVTKIQTRQKIRLDNNSYHLIPNSLWNYCVASHVMTLMSNEIHPKAGGLTSTPSYIFYHLLLWTIMFGWGGGSLHGCVTVINPTILSMDISLIHIPVL